MLAAILGMCLIAGVQSNPAPAASPAASQVPGYRISVPRVELATSVTERKTGKPVLGLRAADFRILDDGKPAALTNFEPTGHTRPLMVWLLFRNDYIDQKTLPRIEAEMPAALKVLPDSAWVGVASYSMIDSVLWLSPQPGRAAALAAIHRLVLANPDVPAQKPARKAGSDPSQSTTSPVTPAWVDREQVKHPYGHAFVDWGPSGGLQIIEKDWAAHRDPGFLPVVVLLSDDLSKDFIWSARRQRDELLRDGLLVDVLEEPHGALSRSMAAMFKIYAPTGIPLSPGSQMYRYRYEAYLAKATGGEVVAIKAHNYRNGFARVFRDLNAEYELEFAPARINGKWHSISVSLQPDPEIRPSRYRIRVRQRYLAGSSASGSAPSSSAPAQ